MFTKLKQKFGEIQKLEKKIATVESKIFSIRQNCRSEFYPYMKQKKIVNLWCSPPVPVYISIGYKKNNFKFIPKSVEGDFSAAFLRIMEMRLKEPAEMIEMRILNEKANDPNQFAKFKIMIAKIFQAKNMAFLKEIETSFELSSYEELHFVATFKKTE